MVLGVARSTGCSSLHFCFCFLLVNYSVCLLNITWENKNGSFVFLPPSPSLSSVSPRKSSESIVTNSNSAAYTKRGDYIIYRFYDPKISEYFFLVD